MGCLSYFGDIVDYQLIFILVLKSIFEEEVNTIFDIIY